MTRASPTILVGSWLGALLLVVVSFSALDWLAPADNRYQHQTRQQIQNGWNSDESDELRVAIIGDSLSVAGFGSGEFLESSLANAGIGATVLNVSGPGASLRDFGPLVGDLLDAEPDVVLLQADVLWDEPAGWGSALRGRIGRWVARQARSSINDGPAAFCRQFDQDSLETVAANSIEAFEQERLLESEAASFFNEAHARGIRVIITQPPTSNELRVATLGLRGTQRTRTLEFLTQWPDVLVAPEVELPDSADYCGLLHLNHGGRMRFVEAFSLSSGELLEPQA